MELVFTDFGYLSIAHCKNLMKIFQSQKTCQMKWAWNCSILLVILAKMQIFKANFRPECAILCKNCKRKMLRKIFKEFKSWISKGQLSELGSYWTFSKVLFSKKVDLLKSIKEATKVAFFGFKSRNWIAIFIFIIKKYHVSQDLVNIWI